MSRTKTPCEPKTRGPKPLPSTLTIHVTPEVLGARLARLAAMAEVQVKREAA